MQYEVSGIHSYDNDNEKATAGVVHVLSNDYQLVLDVFVKIPLEWGKTLEQTHQALIDEAIMILRRMAKEL